MSKPKHIRLLELLATNSVVKPTSISSFIANEFIKPNKKDPNLNHGNDPAVMMLTELEFRQFLSFTDDSMVAINNGEDKKWFDELDILVNITSDGLDYLQKHELNLTSIKASKRTLWTFWSTISLSFLTVFITLATFIETKSNSRGLIKIEQRIDSLSMQLLRMQIRQNTPQSPKSYHVDSLHTYRPSALNK